jgi:pilus assembly protein Flp/PilA
VTPSGDQDVENGVDFWTIAREKRFAMLQLFAVSVAATLKSRKGISALEYAILAGVLVGIITTAVTTFGGDISSLFSNVGTNLKSAIPAT